MALTLMNDWISLTSFKIEILTHACPALPFTRFHFHIHIHFHACILSLADAAYLLRTRWLLGLLFSSRGDKTLLHFSFPLITQL